MTRVLHGIIPPMVTPLAGKDKLDVNGLERLIDHILAGGVHGLFILGTTGEAPSLSHALRRELIERTCHRVAGRVPVLVGITDTSFAEQVSLAQHAHEHQASALVTAPPYYFPAGQAELEEYVQHLLPELPLPLMLYNMPSHTKIDFEPDTLRRLVHHDGIIGLKDSSGNMKYFHQVQEIFRDRPDLSLLIGPEELLGETLLMGGHGGVSGGANLFPKLYVSMYNAATARDLDQVQHLHSIIMQLLNSIYSVGHYQSSIIKGLKCALNLLGICNDFLAEPFHRFRGEEREAVQRHLTALQAALSSEG